jgi:RNA polymerase sigma-70 factor (ECF subfamily)
VEKGDDAMLVERSVSRPETFAELYERYTARLHRYVARRVGADTADDVVAETFLIAFRLRERYDPARGDALPWLYGIASNLIARQRRSETRMYRAYARTGTDPVMEPYLEADARVVADGYRGPLARALARLSAKDRDVLLLIAWGELSYEQVAEALNIPVGTVRSRLNRARRKVKSALDEINPMDRER